MLCRAVLTAVAISYLICVLWLSGIQREDLDVNMLRKLQRHNVNIDDMSRESLKRQCLDFKNEKDNVTRKIKKKEDDEDSKTTTEYVNLGNEKDVKHLKKVLNNLMDAKMIKTIEDNTSTTKGVTLKLPSIQENENIQNPISEIIIYPSEEEHTETVDVVNNNNQSKLDSILDFWKMFRSTSSYSIVTKSKLPEINPMVNEEINEQNNKKAGAKKSRSKQTEYINKILADIVYTSTQSTTQQPTTKPVDLKKLSDQIEKLLQLYPQKGTLGNSDNLPKSEVEIVKAVPPDGYYFFKNGIPKKTEILAERIKQYDSYERKIKSNNNHQFSMDYSKTMSRVPVKALNNKQNQQSRERGRQYGSYEGNNRNNKIRIVPIDVPDTAPYSVPIRSSKESSNKKQIEILQRDKSIERIQQYYRQNMKNYNNRQSSNDFDKNIASLPRLPEQNLSNKQRDNIINRQETMESIKKYDKNRILSVHLPDSPIGIPMQTLKNEQKEISQRQPKEKIIQYENNDSNIKNYNNHLLTPDVERNIDTLPNLIERDILNNRHGELMQRQEYILERNKQYDAFDERDMKNMKYALPSMDFPKNPTSSIRVPVEKFDDKQSDMLQKQQSIKRIKQYNTFDRNIQNNKKKPFPNELPKYNGDFLDRDRMQILDNYQREIIQRQQPIERIKQYDSNEININKNRVRPNDYPENTVPIQIPAQTIDQNQMDSGQIRQSIAKNINNLNYPSNTRVTESSINVDKKNSGKIITKDCIKEIAENVKAIVLKDLRNEISTPASTPAVTTITTTITTTSSSPKTFMTVQSTTEKPNAIPQQNKTQVNAQVIAKFMELFEQFTNLNQKTETNNPNKLPQNKTNTDVNNIFKINRHMPKVWNTSNKIMKPPENIYNVYSGVRTPKIVPNFSIQSANLLQIHPMTVPSQSFQGGKPITIQTNSDEIRPLGIPITNPLKLIHQIIVVTTTNPVVTHRYHRDDWVEHYEHKDNEPKESYKQSPINSGYILTTEMNSNNDRLDEYENLQKDKSKAQFDQNRYKIERLHEYKQRFKDDIKYMDHPFQEHRLREFKSSYNEDKSYNKGRISDSKDDKVTKQSYQKPYERLRYYYSNDNSKRVTYKSLYDDVINLKFNEHKNVYDDKEKHPDTVSYGVVSRNRNSPRFHEKLERVDDWRSESRNTEDKKNCEKPSVAPRQQQPLNVKDSRFDDTHFKNFLKTQQKVNDMLEKILSSKSSQIGPQSVETT